MISKTVLGPQFLIRYYRSQPQMVTSLLREVINLKAVINELSVQKVVIFLAHLSQRLIGELIGYSWSGVRWRRRSQCSKIFFSETALPIKAKFYVEPPWVGGTIFCSRHLGHMTKMAATPIYGNNLAISYVY